MLKTFAYLDTDLLQQLIDQIDGGSLKQRSVEDSITSSKSGSGNLRFASGKIGQGNSLTTTQQFEMSPSAQFNRLHSYCEKNAEETGWEYIEDPAQFTLLHQNPGKLVESQVNISIPQAIKGIDEAAKYSSFLEDASAFKAYLTNWDEEEMQKDLEQARLLQRFQQYLQGKLIVEADFTNGVNAKYVGKLNKKFIKNEDELENDGYTIIGKVKDTWGKGEWRQPLLLSVMNVFNREDRRKIMGTKPNKGDESNFIEGPAALLQILAIYY